MELDDLRVKSREFSELEGRASFYDIAVEIVDAYPLQASIIILATWNVSRFRFIVSDSKNLSDLREALQKCLHFFKELEGMELQSVDFNEIGGVVKEIYSILSKVKGVEYTGASKVMHLINRELFVMWDSYIRKGYDLKKNDAGDYINFLKKIQSEIKGIKWNEPNKTLAKAVDEYNYVVFSLPAINKKKITKT